MSENNVNDNAINWRKIGEQLRRPFDPRDVDFRPQMSGKSDPGQRVQAVCYIDARAVADRLDDVVGPGAWSFHYEPLVIERGEVQLAKGALTIYGVTKEDVGDASTFATSKGCVSDALKRAAVLWGIGRYLYEQPSEWVTLDQHKRISEGDIAKLRARLPRPDGAQPATPPPPPAPARNTTTSAAASEDEPATPEQQERLRQYRNILKITDRSIAQADNRLRRGEAEARISHYIEQDKQRHMRMPAPTAAQNGARP